MPRRLAYDAAAAASRPPTATNVGPPNCGAEMYAGRVACCPLVSHDECTEGRDGRTTERYVTLSARRGQRNKSRDRVDLLETLPTIVSSAQRYST